MSSCTIITDRFYLRPLKLDDVTPRYLSWFRDLIARKYIVAAESLHNIDELRSYVKEKANKEDVLFLGIFCKEDDLHIGNIKYEPIDTNRHFAVMGIMIGDSAFRGIGVSSEVILASAKYLKKEFGIKHILLGVEKSNSIAIKSYEKIGFVFVDCTQAGLGEKAVNVRCMELQID